MVNDTGRSRLQVNGNNLIHAIEPWRLDGDYLFSALLSDGSSVLLLLLLRGGLRDGRPTFHRDGNHTHSTSVARI